MTWLWGFLNLSRSTVCGLIKFTWFQLDLQSKANIEGIQRESIYPGGICFYKSQTHRNKLIDSKKFRWKSSIIHNYCLKSSSSGGRSERVISFSCAGMKLSFIPKNEAEKSEYIGWKKAIKHFKEKKSLYLFIMILIHYFSLSLSSTYIFISCVFFVLLYSMYKEMWNRIGSKVVYIKAKEREREKFVYKNYVRFLL